MNPTRRMKMLTGRKRETLLLVCVSLAVAAELTWVVHHVSAEVIESPRVTGNPTGFTETVIHAANLETHSQH